MLQIKNTINKIRGFADNYYHGITRIMEREVTNLTNLRSTTIPNIDSPLIQAKLCATLKASVL